MSTEENLNLRNDTHQVYIKLPHKDGPAARCANPLAKGYLSHFEKGTLHSEYPYAKEALEMNASCSYWISARERIRSQMVVYASQTDPSSTSSDPVDKSLGFILPRVIPMGTITRRAVENTWLTAANAKSNRVGSELKSMIVAPRTARSPSASPNTTSTPSSPPQNYAFVGADVDSQELWIASLLGDSQFALHGSTALGFQTLEGSKSLGTDLHSRTAKILGISRNDAKVFNYGRIYGAGLNFAGTLLRQFNPALSAAETTEIAERLYKETKGVRTSRKALHPTGFFRAGTESMTFNILSALAEHPSPRTPVLGAGITEALQRRFISRGEFITSRVNWAIQSSGVDYLHLLIVSMDYLTRRFAISARLALTVHDEIRYLVKETDKYRAALALQIANLWTRAYFAEMVGIRDLPQGCAFFSAVDVDSVLRKEVSMDCVTPSHREAIPEGESLGIGELLGKGDEARLDIGKDVAEEDLPRPERYSYTPKPPIMASLRSAEGGGGDGAERGSARDTLFLRAQIAGTEEEVRALLREARDLTSTTNKTDEFGGTMALPFRDAVSKTSKPRSKSKSTSKSKSQTHEDNTTGEVNKPKVPRTRRKKQEAGLPDLPQGVMLPELPWFEARKFEDGSRRWNKWVGNAAGNGRGGRSLGA